jgi:hypothetical protein
MARVATKEPSFYSDRDGKTMERRDNEKTSEKANDMICLYKILLWLPC